MRIHNRTQVGSYLMEYHKTFEASHGASSFLGSSVRGGGVFLIFSLAIEGVLLMESHLSGHVSKTSISPLDPERALPGRVCLRCLHPTPTCDSLVATDLPVRFTHFLLQESTEDERI